MQPTQTNGSSSIKLYIGKLLNLISRMLSVDISFKPFTYINTNIFSKIGSTEKISSLKV